MDHMESGCVNRAMGEPVAEGAEKPSSEAAREPGRQPVKSKTCVSGQSGQERKPGKSSQSLGTVIQRKPVLHE